jgi:predicted DNA-binding transcriptional regulator YafY
VRRADRLFQIVQHLRGRRLTTAAQLAEWLEVSVRTVYRDVRDLSLSGVPIEGEAGVGYRIAKTFDLPPIMFTFDEVEALVAGTRMVQAWGGPALAASSRNALAKITLALPPERRESVERTRIFAPGFHVPTEFGPTFEAARQAILARNTLRLEYAAPEDRTSTRVVWPLGLYFWGPAWTLAAWCELRVDFRNFRVDRIASLEVLADTFPEDPERNLDAFLRKMSAGRA